LGIVDAAKDKNMKIILGCWDQASSKDGKIDEGFYEMWDIVIDRLKNEGHVYFEIMNEPFGYSKYQLRDLCANWLNRYPEVPKGRVLVPGRGYSAYVNEIASDSRFNGCLFSQHIYPWFGKHTNENSWKRELRKRVGSSYKSRTVVTEFGAEMTTGYVYQYPISGSNHEKQHMAFMFGVPNQIRDWDMGSMYWPGFRDGDWYRLFTRNGTTLTKVNESGAFQVWWSYNK
ncbi:MAG: glycoside hydrolase family 5 protein, partial [Bacteroidales bacterium]|nr:glycoside hydrolase family 5 protein [Bacteroidales bacterium]